GFDDVPTLSTLYQRFTCVRLHGTYLIPSRGTFSLTLTTMAFDHSSLRWFGAFTCMTAPRGLPSSSVQHGCSFRSQFSNSFLRLRGAQSSAYRTMITSPRTFFRHLFTHKSRT